MQMQNTALDDDATVWTIFQIGIERFNMSQLILEGQSRGVKSPDCLKPDVESIEAACLKLQHTGLVIRDSEGFLELTPCGMKWWESKFHPQWESSFVCECDEEDYLISCATTTTIVKSLVECSFLKFIDVSSIAIKHVSGFLPLYWHHVSPALTLTFRAHSAMEIPFVLQAISSSTFRGKALAEPVALQCEKLIKKIEQFERDLCESSKWYLTPRDVIPR